jgi:TonB-dependent starch-binding outer membrane protein SusC
MKAKTIFAVLLAVLVPSSLYGQTTGQITGVVTSDVGQPLAGVQVSVMGTQLGSITGADGRYTISNVSAGEHAVRAISVGYGSQEQTVTVTAGSAAVLNFELASRAVVLEGVVAVGYGTQRREQVTGAIASVDSEQFVAGPARDAAALIAGQMPGLAVVRPSGDPRSNSQIQLRGTTTIQGPTNPLILIDGVPGELETVPAEDIESISVLKDGSAAAVYGSRASNGVILITTRRHAGGAPTLRYDGYVSRQTIYNQPDFLSAGDYRRLINEGVPFEDLGFETNWMDQVLRNPASHRHNLTLSGGAPNTNYTASLNFEDEQGIFQRSDNQEITARANIRHQMFDGLLEAEANLLSRTQSFFTGPNFNYIWRQTLIRNPTDRVLDDDGSWQLRSGYFYDNPLNLLNEQHGETEVRQQRMHGTLTLRPIEQLRLSLMGGTSRSNMLSGNATTFGHINTVVNNLGGTAARSTNANLDRILELTGTFAERIGDHNFTLLGGYAYHDFEFESFNASNQRFPTDLFGYHQLQQGSGLGEGIASMSSNKNDYTLVGFFGRLNYDWNNRYLLMGSLRYEGNSRFGADHKWGLFPAISAGWRISEEAFLQGLPFDDLRLRVGYGLTGIAPGQSYLSLTSYAYGARFLYNGEWVQQLAPARNPNPNLRWEEKSELNLGLNFALFDSRLYGAADVYRRETRDMLYSYSVPVPPNLFGSMLANVGTMRNNGVELELGYEVVARPGLRWTTSANWSTNSNTLVTLSDDTFQPQSDCFQPGAGHTGEPIQQFTHQVCVGGPIGNFYGFHAVDIDNQGEWIIQNEDGDLIPIRQATAGDRTVLGNGLPKQTFAWNNQAHYRNFDLSLNLRGAAGFQILNYMRMYYENPRIVDYNKLHSAFEPVFGKRQLNYDLAYTSYYIEDGDYLKLDNLTLGYTFRPGTLGPLSNAVSNARIYLSGRNLHTFTGYKGLDPEVNVTGLAPGNDSRDTYPTTRMFTVGATVSF